jgi:3-methyladenine DNA glycosylase/8-oxoguanine DNA glycosylase
LINAGFLDEHSVEDLATMLGMGARHLTRLFMRHLGAPPGSLARTRRVQLAKKLLDETDLSVTEIAFVAGFSSIRRFNSVFKDTYGRSPFPGQHLLRLSLQLPDYARLKHIMEHVRTMFDLSANPGEIGRHLGRHPELAPVVQRAPGLRLPGAWDAFEVAVRVLVARDVGRAGTAAVMGTLAATYGQPLAASADHGVTTLFPAAASLMPASLANLGLSRRAAHGIQRLAHAVVRGDLRFDPRVSFDALVSSLTREAELDLASAHWVALRALGEPDANPFGAASALAPAAPPWLDATAQEALRPRRSYAAVLLALPCTSSSRLLQ